MGYNPGTPTEQGYGWKWQKLRIKILKRDGYQCRLCGDDAREVDHIKPKANGGTDDEDNLQALCVACHRVKTAKESNKGHTYKAHGCSVMGIPKDKDHHWNR